MAPTNRYFDVGSRSHGYSAKDRVILIMDKRSYQYFCLCLGVLIVSLTIMSLCQNLVSSGYADIPEVIQKQGNLNEAPNPSPAKISDLANKSGTTVHYLYGCTYYEYYGFYCNPISNEFDSYAVLANYTKVTSATREPDFVVAKFGKGLQIAGGDKNHESLRANDIDVYNASQFSVYLSFRSDKFSAETAKQYMSLVSFKNGTYREDPHTAGWDIELVPSNSESMKTLRFTVYNTEGANISSNNIDIPTEKFLEITGTFNGKTVRVFVNGTLKSEIPFHGNYSGRVDSEIIISRSLGIP